MFDVGAPEMLVLVIAAVFIFGPDKLPEFARQAARMLRSLRQLAANARSELGPEFDHVDLSDLNPRSLLQRHVLDVLDEDDEDDEQPMPDPALRPLPAGELPPYDPDST
jgi:sec-independent protein translocase protein TatB